MASNFSFFKVKLKCFGDPSKDMNFFLRGKEGQTIGDALYCHLVSWDVSVQQIRASCSSDDGKTSTITPSDTPVDVLESFGTKHIFVDIISKGSTNDPAVNPKSTVNVFDVLMKVQKKYDKLPPSRAENTAKDRMYNLLLKLFKKECFGFTNIQVDTTGVYVIRTLTRVLWYLDPHIKKFRDRSIYFHDFTEFKGFNDWRHQKKKEPKVISTDLEHEISEILTMLGHPYFLCTESQKLLKMCNNLVDGMKRYLEFLNQQKEKTAANHESLEPVRSLSDNWSLKTTVISQSLNNNYVQLHQALGDLEPFDPLFLYNIQPDDRFDRRKWIDNMSLPYPVKIYTHRFGNYLGNFNFVWTIEEDDENEGDLDAISYIKENMPLYTTRAMRKEFMNRYAKAGPKPCILRDMFRFLTGDLSSPESTKEKAVDERVLDFLLATDSAELVYDLRRNNGRLKNPALEPFWTALDAYLEEVSVVQERRNSDKMYMPLAISTEHLIDIIKSRLPAGSQVPTRSWLSLNFWPSNAFVRSCSSMLYWALQS